MILIKIFVPDVIVNGKGKPRVRTPGITVFRRLALCFLCNVEVMLQALTLGKDESPIVYP
jgi:hypothetical protein